MSVRRTAKVWFCPVHGAVDVDRPNWLPACVRCNGPCEVVEMVEFEVDLA